MQELSIQFQTATGSVQYMWFLKRRSYSGKDNKNELIPMRTVTGHKVCIDYRKLNAATRKDHFPTLHRSDVRKACTPQVLLFSRWVFEIFPDSYPSGRPRKDYIHLSIWYFRVPQDALWAL